MSEKLQKRKTVSATGSRGVKKSTSTLVTKSRKATSTSSMSDLASGSRPTGSGKTRRTTLSGYGAPRGLSQSRSEFSNQSPRPNSRHSISSSKSKNSSFIQKVNQGHIDLEIFI